MRSTQAFSQTWRNEVGFAYAYGAIISDPTGLVNKANSPDIQVALPFVSTLPRVPAVAPGYSSVTGFGSYRDFNRDYNIYDNVTHIQGNHSIKFGVNFHRYQKTENAGGNNVGSFAFSNTLARPGLQRRNSSGQISCLATSRRSRRIRQTSHRTCARGRSSFTFRMTTGCDPT